MEAALQSQDHDMKVNKRPFLMALGLLGLKAGKEYAFTNISSYERTSARVLTSQTVVFTMQNTKARLHRLIFSQNSALT